METESSVSNSKKDTAHYSVAILCGGRSTRMGQDKAEMKIQAGGPRMAERLLAAFSGCAEILLSVRDEEQAEKLLSVRDGEQAEKLLSVRDEEQAEKLLSVRDEEQAEKLLSVRDEAQAENLLFVTDRKQAEEGIRYVIDPVQNAGPLSGIVASLRACREEWLFVTAVDMPYMDKDFADNLFALKKSDCEQITQMFVSEAAGLPYSDTYESIRTKRTESDISDGTDPHRTKRTESDISDGMEPLRTKRTESDNPDGMEPHRTERVVPNIPDAIIPVNPDGHVQPMSAFYNKKALQILEDCLQNKTYSLWRCFQKLQVVRIPVERIPDSSRKLVNLNRPEDLADCVRSQERW